MASAQLAQVSPVKISYYEKFQQNLNQDFLVSDKDRSVGGGWPNSPDSGHSEGSSPPVSSDVPSPGMLGLVWWFKGSPLNLCGTTLLTLHYRLTHF